MADGEYRIRLSKRISVSSCGMTLSGRHLIQPNITAISQPMYTIGVTVADLLLKRISGSIYVEENPIKITLETTFNIRDSA
jgi:DNA-binding LacI/PurR family transcriptional regulator